MGNRLAIDSLPWMPTAIATSLWLDANDSETITESGGLVSSWADKSGNGNNATQSSDSKKPSIGSILQNNINVLTFDGSDILNLNSALTELYGACSVFIIGEGDSDMPAGANTFLYSGPGASSGHYFYTYISQSNGYFNWDTNTSFGGYNLTIANNYKDNNFHLFCGQKNADNSTPYLAVDSGTPNSSVSTVSLAGSPDITNIGGTLYNSSEIQFLKGNIGEIIVCNYVLSTANRQKMEGYLAWKWGLVSNLPSDHPYKNQRPLL